MIGRKQFIEWFTTTLREAAWAPLGVFGFYLIGLAFGLYKAYPPLDIPTHFMGGLSITHFFCSAIRKSQVYLGGIPSLIQILFAFTCTGTMIIVWEFYENAFDFLFGTTMVRGLQDTITDMFVGLLGALMWSVFHSMKRN